MSTSTARHRYTADNTNDSATIPNGTVRVDVGTGDLYRWDSRRSYWDAITVPCWTIMSS